MGNLQKLPIWHYRYYWPQKRHDYGKRGCAKISFGFRGVFRILLTNISNHIYLLNIIIVLFNLSCFAINPFCSDDPPYSALLISCKNYVSTFLQKWHFWCCTKMTFLVLCKIQKCIVIARNSGTEWFKIQSF